MTDSTLEQRKSLADIVRSWPEVFGLEIKYWRFTLGITLAMGTAAVYVLQHHGYVTPENIMSLLRAHPFLAPIVFLAIYVLSVMCFIPTLPLNLGAGLIWGPYWGGLLTVLGATAGAVGAFLAARYLAADYLNAWFSNRIWSWLRGEVLKKGWKMVVFVRINPIFPFGPASYLFGLTSINFRHYLLTTMLSVVPLSVTFAAVGHSLGSIVLEGDAGALFTDILVVSLAATTLAFLRIAFRRMTKLS